ncbi:conserved hypothetical protein [Methanocaldococcus vulcanius M7]|uniref:Uncharacterized protein n=1 Tax=Methanocaldococcus vulcanius (strain ATCC 700851 / DSM 12094 / M7) TaxID=579137 RepID=C9RFX0_METVM|nr:hypothetical protein [Methanocaldococcus vulcanius]ACX72472.1 conserved hypothetical protein [Methanocaldococcus vulcanius M7]
MKLWSKGIFKIFALVAMLCVVGSVFATSTSLSEVSKKPVGVEKVDIKILKKTPTEQIVEVNGVIIKYHTDGKVATLQIKDKKTGKTINYKFITKKVKDTYLTEMYMNGKKFKTIKTFYNPIEKGMTLKKAMEINKKKLKDMKVNAKIGNILPMSYTTTHYWWDGVYYVEGRGIKYAHPDYDYYGIEPWNTKVIHGNRLYHIHLAQVYSNDAPAVIGAIVGILVGLATEGSAAVVYGGISSAVTDIIMNHGMSAIEDENGCIWYVWGLGFWYSYERIGPYVIKDIGGIGEPHP